MLPAKALEGASALLTVEILLLDLLVSKDKYNTKIISKLRYLVAIYYVLVIQTCPFVITITHLSFTKQRTTLYVRNIFDLNAPKNISHQPKYYYSIVLFLKPGYCR
jgi:hypothetical protein